jgi:hypothetical protein
MKDTINVGEIIQFVMKSDEDGLDRVK